MAQTLTNDSSVAAAVATSGIGDSAVALTEALRPNGIAQHIRTLKAIAAAGVAHGRDHIVGQAMRELARTATALTTLAPRHIMPGSLYENRPRSVQHKAADFENPAQLGGERQVDVCWAVLTGWNQ